MFDCFPYFHLPLMLKNILILTFTNLKQALSMQQSKVPRRAEKAPDDTKQRFRTDKIPEEEEN